ncbi:GNAT family N-acetyltransferase [Nocardia sp. NPDC058666]|uniref:GNAT family N-acetyltransferase n=1 Tax=Nocardia sp. NPDC058666 TaxID=3346587 RepID=UPI0036679A70
MVRRFGRDRAGGVGIIMNATGVGGRGIRARGETPFLHAIAHNTSAISLYETLGFTVRKRSMLTLMQAP